MPSRRTSLFVELDFDATRAESAAHARLARFNGIWLIEVQPGLAAGCHASCALDVLQAKLGLPPGSAGVVAMWRGTPGQAPAPIEPHGRPSRESFATHGRLVGRLSNSEVRALRQALRESPIAPSEALDAAGAAQPEQPPRASGIVH